MVTVIIQARMGSTRLPEKIFKKILAKPMLEYMIERVRRAKTIDKIIIATTTNSGDEKVVSLAKKLGLAIYRGSENDVLDRYYQAAKKFKSDIIVRLTGDCPLIDPFILDKVVSFFKKNKFDYASNTHPPTFPDGMDVEVFSFKALEKAWREAKLSSEREHVTPYIIKRPRKFRIANVENTEDLSRLRLTVDEPEDLSMVSKLAEFFSRQNKKDFGLREIVDLWHENPSLFKSNQFIKRNEGYQKSLMEDRKK